MTFEFLENLTLISSASIFIPLIIGLSKFRSLNYTQKLLFYLVIASSITETVVYVLSEFQLPNIAVYNIYTFANFNIIFSIYLTQVSPKRKNAMIGLQIAFNLFMIINAIFIQSFQAYNSYAILSMSVIFMSLALNYFYKLLKEVKHQRLEKNPLFWLSSGLVVYYSGTLILFLFINQISNADQSNIDLHLASWGINSIFILLIVTSYSLTLWVRPTK